MDGLYHEMVYKLTSESGATFTDDALETLVLAANEYMQEVFDEVHDVQMTRREQINDIDERLRLLQDETVKLEEKKTSPRMMTISRSNNATFLFFFVVVIARIDVLKS